ncbi:MAG: pyridoxamine 5'-phosphate oxidase family protein [Gemmatimonadota bacterium]|nr:pyridoxamine 5'-phosphate oxidase family protein [Gemmatimonadota bacterium]
MADTTENSSTSKAEKTKEFHALVDDIKLGMLVTQTPDGALVSRAMQTQKRRPGVDLWFVTSTETHKVAELEANPEVNVTYVDNSSRDWVSVSGTARITQDRNLIRELYQPDWKAWFPEQSPELDGSTEDPRIVIIEIDAHSVTYLKGMDSRPVAMFKVLRAMATGTKPDLGETKNITK